LDKTVFELTILEVVMEEKEQKESLPLVAKIRLKDRDENGQYGAFVIGHRSHPALVDIVAAFNNSNTVKLGYSTIQKDKGLHEPTMKRKNLYLAGESVRNHLKNLPFEVYELVTEASPDEIKKILKLTKLEECKPKCEDIELLKKYRNLKDCDDNCFYVSRWDNDKDELEITALVNGQKVHLDSFGFHSKNRMISPEKAKFGTTIEEDASTRDLTINAMYIKLKTEDGENGELVDPQGGFHDLKAGILQTIGKPERALQRNPYLPFILCNIAAKFTDDGKIPDKLKHEIENLNLPKLDPQILKHILLRGLEDNNLSFSSFYDNLYETNLLEKILPNLKFSDICSSHVCVNIPKDKIVALGFILKDNDPNEVLNILSTNGFSNTDAESVSFLVRIARIVKADIRHEFVIQKLLEKPVLISKNKIKQFLSLLGNTEFFQKFFSDKIV